MKSSYMNVEQAAEYLKVSPVTIYRLVRKGDIPAAKIGNSWRFQQEMLDEWIGQKMRANTKS